MSIWDDATKGDIKDAVTEAVGSAMGSGISQRFEGRKDIVAEPATPIVTEKRITPAPPKAGEAKKHFHEGKKSLGLSLLAAIVGTASVAGYLPSIPASEGIEILKGSGILSGLRLLMDAPLRIVERYIGGR